MASVSNPSTRDHTPQIEAVVGEGQRVLRKIISRGIASMVKTTVDILLIGLVGCFAFAVYQVGFKSRGAITNMDIELAQGVHPVDYTAQINALPGPDVVKAVLVPSRNPNVDSIACGVYGKRSYAVSSFDFWYVEGYSAKSLGIPFSPIAYDTTRIAPLCSKAFQAYLHPKTDPSLKGSARTAANPLAHQP